MRYRVKGATLILGPLRKDGWRRVYAVRLRNWSGVERMLRAAKMTIRPEGDALFVRVANPNQRVFAFLEPKPTGATP